MSYQSAERNRSNPLPKVRAGDIVSVRMDDGKIAEWTVKYIPWSIGNGRWLIGLVGMPGGYDTSRVVAHRPVHHEAPR